MAKTNYNKMSRKTPKEPKIETGSFEIEQTTTEIPVEETPVPEFKKGIVNGCIKLNVRKEPKADAEIIGTLDAGSIVTVYDEIDGFYKVGPTNEYCMKKYISVK